MDQHRLYRTIESLSVAQFATQEELLIHVLESIIKNEEIPILGGRIWKLDASTGTYRLISQHGDVEPIKRSFRIRIDEYPPFLQLYRKGTIVGTETNRYLRDRGIRWYSATGAGEILSWKGHKLYQYVVAINADYLKQDMNYALKIIGNVLTTALKNRLIVSKAEALERDLDKAAQIQKSILPEHEFKFFNFDMYGVSLPERVVGGDFFDYLQASGDKDRIGVVIGDAASKGFSAAAEALYVSGALKMGVEYQTKITTLIRRVNRLVNKTFSTEHFLSMVFAELTNSDKGLVFYVNAGHSNPILLHSKTDEVEFLPATGQLLGPFPNETYHAEFAFMQKGDVLLLFTDGVSEAANESRELYGTQRLVKLLKEHRNRTPKEICQRILEDVQLHNRLVEYSDDKTLVAIKRTR